MTPFRRHSPVWISAGPTYIDTSCARVNDPRKECLDGRQHKWSSGWITFCLHCSMLQSEALSKEDPNTWDRLHARREELQRESDIKEKKRLNDEGFFQDKDGRWVKPIPKEELNEFWRKQQ